jgi:hypothetical protein
MSKTQIVSYFSHLCTVLLIVLLLLFSSIPAQAAVAIASREPLSLELLQTRINTPIQSEGVSTIDLSKLSIDLTTQNLEFREQFYQQLQDRINRSKTPLGIDLSDSLIKGDFQISKLGLPTPFTPAAISSLLTPLEQEQLQKEQRFALAPGEQLSTIIIWRGALKIDRTIFSGKTDFSHTFFLQKIEANNAVFVQESDWNSSRFTRKNDFDNSTFERDVNFSNSKFFDKISFKQVKFLGLARFTNINFYEKADFSQTKFKQLANFEKNVWFQNVDFSQVNWSDRALFSKNQFYQLLLLSNSTFEKAAAFRNSFFQKNIELNDSNLLDQIDFSNSIFKANSFLNVDGLAFDSDKAKIIGDTGTIGQAISVPVLEGNENVLRNLVRNFRSLEQIPDANQIEYKSKKLQLKQISEQIVNSDLTRIFKFNWVESIFKWLGLALLLLLGDYGTNFSVVFGVGTIAIAYFGLLFWLVDRYRRRLPQPILPNRYETICMTGSFSILALFGIAIILKAADRPLLTLACLAFVLLPTPLLLLVRLYQQGRYHNLLDVTYFVEDGSMRQFRIMIGRLPIMPRFPFFRDRYQYILWDRRWNWLNYYDFSLNNLLRLGFNDLRVRDEHLPGIVSTLVWYQWSLGVLYIILLLWTLSRTIPGLNLLIYF